MPASQPIGPPALVAGPDPSILLLCDHASNAVPAGVHLGVPAAALETHIAWDIGAAAVTQAVAAALACPAILATVSRLVVDTNRPPDGAVPQHSDGVAIPGNVGLAASDLAARIALHAQFHAAIEAAIAARPPRLLVSIHSFTPALASASAPSASAPRPWPIALLWNRDARAAAIALDALAHAGLEGPVGANEPYSGRVLNYTMDRHAEARGTPYLGFEIRQDLIADAAGVARFADLVARTIRHTLEHVPASESPAGKQMSDRL